MSSIANRLLLGLAAGALSHLVFQGSFGTLLHAVGLLPSIPFSLRAVPPFGVPQTVSLAFWAALWGVLYAWVEPWLTARLGCLRGGVLFGVALPLPVHWFIATPLRGLPIAGGFDPVTVLIEVGFHAVFGLGLAVLLRAAARGLGTAQPVANA